MIVMQYCGQREMCPDNNQQRQSLYKVLRIKEEGTKSKTRTLSKV
jgi:hypothetical protein